MFLFYFFYQGAGVNQQEASSGPSSLRHVASLSQADSFHRPRGGNGVRRRTPDERTQEKKRARRRRERHLVWHCGTERYELGRCIPSSVPGGENLYEDVPGERVPGRPPSRGLGDVRYASRRYDHSKFNYYRRGEVQRFGGACRSFLARR